MVRAKEKRWVPVVLAAIAALVAAGAVGFRLAGRALEEKVVQALGPQNEEETSASD